MRLLTSCCRLQNQVTEAVYREHVLLSTQRWARRFLVSSAQTGLQKHDGWVTIVERTQPSVWVDRGGIQMGEAGTSQAP